jgi:hypothetical protein
VLEKSGEVGVAYFQDGEVVDAAFQDKSGKNALYEFFKWREGVFKFSPGLVPTRTTIDLDWPALILEGARQVNDMVVFTHVIHSPDLIPLSPRRNDRTGDLLDPNDALEHLLDDEEKKVLSYVDGVRSIREISRLESRDVYEIYPHIYRLVAVGLVQVDEYESSQGHSKDLDLGGDGPARHAVDSGKVIQFPMDRVGNIGR